MVVKNKFVKSIHITKIVIIPETSVVLGDPAYYSRFGYTTASTFGVLVPFDVPLSFY